MLYRSVMPPTVLIIVLAFAFSAPVLAEKPKTTSERFSYAVGVGTAQGMLRDGLQVDVEPFLAAIRDVLTGKKPALTPKEMQAAFTAYQKEQEKERKKLAKVNLKKGQAFLATNREEDGVTTLDNGLQYRVVKAGDGKQPGSKDTVTVHYRGRLINGEEFDSSFSRGQPATFPVNGVIAGWQQVLPMMKEGASWQVFIPAGLAYGEMGAGASIGPNETLIFDIELLEVK